MLAVSTPELRDLPYKTIFDFRYLSIPVTVFSMSLIRDRREA